jgi:anaerobic glycerol-3-phosphate dehydrogenase
LGVDGYFDYTASMLAALINDSGCDVMSNGIFTVLV